MTEINIFRNAAGSEEIEQGKELFHQGDAGDVMFAVVDGEIALTHDDRVIEKVGPGGILGEMALVDTGPRSATATASVASRVVRVGQRHFTFLVHEHPTFALQVMKIMAERIRRANTGPDV